MKYITSVLFALCVSTVLYPSHSRAEEAQVGELKWQVGVDGLYLRVKDTGTLTIGARTWVKVLQVVDENNMRIEYRMQEAFGQAGGRVTGGGIRTRELWISGFSTKDLIDGQNLRALPGIWEVGTHSYHDTRGVRRTVLELHPSDPRPADAPPDRLPSK